MKEVAHIITGMHTPSSAIKTKNKKKKDVSLEGRMEIKAVKWETAFERTKCSLSLFPSVPVCPRSLTGSDNIERLAMPLVQ